MQKIICKQKKTQNFCPVHAEPINFLCIHPKGQCNPLFCFSCESQEESAKHNHSGEMRTVHVKALQRLVIDQQVPALQSEIQSALAAFKQLFRSSMRALHALSREYQEMLQILRNCLRKDIKVFETAENIKRNDWQNMKGSDLFKFKETAQNLKLYKNSNLLIGEVYMLSQNMKKHLKAVEDSTRKTMMEAKMLAAESLVASSAKTFDRSQIKQLNSQIRTNPTKANDYFNRAMHLRKFCEPSCLPELDYRKCIDIKHNYGAAYNNLGAIFEEENPDESLRFYLQAVKAKDGQSEINLRNVGFMLIELEEFVKAEQYLRKSNEVKPSPFAFTQLGVVLAARGQVGEALQALGRAIQLEPKYVSAYRERATIYEAIGRTQDAERDNDQMKLLIQQQK